MRKVVLIMMSLLLLTGVTFTACAKPAAPPEGGALPTAPAEKPAPPKEGVVQCIFASGGPMYPEYAEGFGVNPFLHYLYAATELHPSLKGKFELKLYPNAQLYNQNDAQTALASGAIHLTYGGAHFYEQWNRAWALLHAPGLIDNYPWFMRAIETKPYQDLTKELAGKGITILKWMGNTGDVYVFTSKRCTKLEDLKGLKIRYFAGEPQARVVTALGATPIFLPYTEVVTALQTKQIDGVVTDITGGAFFYELARYCPNMLPYVWSIQPYCMACNTKWHESLPSNPDLLNPGMREAFDRVFDGIETWPFYERFQGMVFEIWKGTPGTFIADYDPAEAKRFKDISLKAIQPIIADIDPKYIQAIESVR
ncbi:MAG: hypothetical protein FJ005_08430 [Chloroflexi bacterium]|nr:hypothetical protein [Chloroflexota bacterium]